MSNPITIREIAKHNLKDPVLIDGFPGVGLVGTIVANFLINTLKLEQIGVIDSYKFPPISVVKDGCSGNSYTMDIAEISPHQKEGAKFFKKNGATVIVEKLSYLFVTGSVLDYTESLLASGFQLSNPNVKGTCSCGSSFKI